MSQKPYSVESHMEGGLRRVYNARRTLSHLDAAILDAEEFAHVQDILADLEELEGMLESSLVEERYQTDEHSLTPVQQGVADD